jgi:two-component sensor histidine kinase
LVRAQLSHFADLIGSRIIVDGPKLRFNMAGAQTIGLALHELATNAGKYGALSTDRGRVDLRWNFSDNAFTMSWTEREGPTVSAPKRCGFGTASSAKFVAAAALYARIVSMTRSSNSGGSATGLSATGGACSFLNQW